MVAHAGNVINIIIHMIQYSGCRICLVEEPFQIFLHSGYTFIVMTSGHSASLILTTMLISVVANAALDSSVLDIVPACNLHCIAYKAVKQL